MKITRDQKHIVLVYWGKCDVKSDYKAILIH